jgi:hypothetical protein
VLTSSPDRWQELSDASHETATAYTWDDATERFERALEYAIERAARGEIAGGPPRPGSAESEI